MARFDAFSLQVARPRMLLILNALVHGVLAALLLQAIADGLGPSAALWSACALILAHCVHEHRRLATPVFRLRIDAERVQLGLSPEQSWQLRQVACATRWLCIAQLEALDPSSSSRHWLVIGGDQLCETDARRLLRWLRVGPTRSVR